MPCLAHAGGVQLGMDFLSGVLLGEDLQPDPLDCHLLKSFFCMYHALGCLLLDPLRCVSLHLNDCSSGSLLRHEI